MDPPPRAVSDFMTPMPERRDRNEEAAHDVLAAEEFPMPAPDPAIQHGPVELPSDLTGSEEPRDVLAAEEFAMPAGSPHAFGPADMGLPRAGGSGMLPLLVLGGLVIVVARRRRRRA